MAKAVTIQRPRRWDTPFSDDMDDIDVERILALDPFREMDLDRFTETLSLAGIISNDRTAC